MVNMPDLFYDRLLEIMKERKIKKKALCRELGVSSSTVSEWIDGQRNMSTVYFMRLCKHLDISPLYMYGEISEKEKYK